MWSIVVDTALEMNMAEKIAREIEKTSESIRKKSCFEDRIEENMALNRHFKLIIKPLR